MKIPLAGVIGCPIGHSRSPVVHGTWLRTHGIRGHYVPLHVAEGDLAQVLAALPRMGFVGANVTIPHKETVLPLADDVSETALRIGAANTLTFGQDGRLYADNTDAYGFIANLRQAVPDWDAARGPALVLGAGGAARAIIVALQDAGVPEIYLSNRTMARAVTLAGEFGVTALPWDQRTQILRDVACIVNTTSLGMAGNAELAVDLRTAQPETLVTDIVYTPLETPLLAAAKAQGCRCVDGLGMLLHQAVPGFERWFGVRPEVTDALRQAVLAP